MHSIGLLLLLSPERWEAISPFFVSVQSILIGIKKLIIFTCKTKEWKKKFKIAKL
jgi:hypothetical protein